VTKVVEAYDVMQCSFFLFYFSFFFAAGGFDTDASVTKVVEAYDVLSGTWTPMPDLQVSSSSYDTHVSSSSNDTNAGPADSEGNVCSAFHQRRVFLTCS